jgi:hypothetical protein
VAMSVALVLALAASSAVAQQITGTPGSPSATTTILGNQLPPLRQPFRGKIQAMPRNRRRTGQRACHPRERRTSS